MPPPISFIYVTQYDCYWNILVDKIFRSGYFKLKIFKKQYSKDSSEKKRILRSKKMEKSSKQKNRNRLGQQKIKYDFSLKKEHKNTGTERFKTAEK